MAEKFGAKLRFALPFLAKLMWTTKWSFYPKKLNQQFKFKIF